MCARDKFERGISRYFNVKQLLQDPDIISPHRKSISSLSIEPTGRFLLAGSADATISIYDLSQWGRRKIDNHNHEGPSYEPVAKSLKVQPRPISSSFLRDIRLLSRIPSGIRPTPASFSLRQATATFWFGTLIE